MVCDLQQLHKGYNVTYLIMQNNGDNKLVENMIVKGVYSKKPYLQQAQKKDLEKSLYIKNVILGPLVEE